MADRSSTPMTAPIPTTPHRTVRFQLDADTAGDWRREPSVDIENDRGWVDQEDFLYSDDEFDDGDLSGSRGDGVRSRAPLLTDREAPAVRVSMDMDSDAAEGALDGGRPKSGMGMAFFNMS